jgi:Tol biopolymer transport system component
VTQRVSVGANGQQGDDYSTRPIVSADGRYVLFSSHATNIGPGGESGWDDVFLRDRQLGTTELISVDSNEVPGNQGGNASAISPDGRYVVFWSSSTNLVPGDTNGVYDVFVRDRLQGTTECVSNYSGGYGHSAEGAISADGRYVTFSYETSGGHLFGNLGSRNIYIWDRQNSTGELVSVPQGAGQTDGDSLRPSISADGRYVAFESKATNLVPGDDNGMSDVFVRDLQTDTTECVSLASGGIPSDGDSGHPSISADGRYVAFVSGADRHRVVGHR